MRTALNYVVPAAAVLFVAYRMRGSVLSVCAVPLVLTMGEAVFLRTWGWTLSVPFVPVPLNWNDVLFAILALSWVIVRERARRRPKIRWDWDVGAVFLLLAVVLLEVPLAWLSDGAVKPGVLVAARAWVYVPVSLLIWVDIFRRSSRTELRGLLAALSLVCVPLALMYCLSSVGIPIYPYLGWAPTTENSATVVRDFLTFPFFVKLALAWYLTRREHTVFTVSAIGVLLGACILTYTRSFMIPAVLAVGFAVIVPVFAAGEGGKAARRLFIFCVVGGACLAILFAAVPGNVEFASQRLGEFGQNRLRSPNVVLRGNTFEQAAKVGMAQGGSLGAGFSVAGAEGLASLERDGFPISENLWSWVVGYLGWLGLTAAAVLFAGFAWKAVVVTHRDGPAVGFGLIMLIVMMWDIIRSLASSEFFTLYPVISGVFMAILIVEARGAWHTRPPPSGEGLT